MKQENYIELYKKYRPKTWEDIIGQDNVVNTLRDVPLTKKVPTGYMFFGTHGCGKTSTAFILAKALNCPNLKPDGNPCNECNICKAIDKSVQPGVRYISMANQGGAEDVRKITREANLAQSINKPVFILDECHRLSPTAWDAFLIPLESENMNALFIFCSTEPDKIPDTIKSRVQVRSFNPVNKRAIALNLIKIIKAEKLDVTKEEVVKITEASKGSVRDSISILENVISNGIIPGSYSSKVLSMLASGKYTELFKLTSEMNENGESFTDVAQQLYKDLASILLVMGGGTDNLSSESKQFKETVNVKLVIRYLSILGNTITQMSYNTIDNRVLFEIGLVDMITLLRKFKSAK